MKLAIISHTPHYKKDGKIVGWGPTVREINHLTKIFDEIYHLAPLHNEHAPESSIAYEDEKINFISLKPFGGESIKNKFSIITTAPFNIRKIKSVIDTVDWVQFRAPTAMGLYVLPYLSIRKKPKRWVKYAGNWMQTNPPLSYGFQRWWLKNNFQKSKVTVNGNWKGQREHIINFRNPCLDNEEIIRAKKIAGGKKFDGKLVIVFVGTLTKNKGVDLIFAALKQIKNADNIKEIIFAGDSKDRKKYEMLSKEIDVAVSFKGFLSRVDLEKIYESAHLILLPSESEGFPKVIAEAAAYGCVPVVSDVSSVSQYFDESKSFLLKKINSVELANKIDEPFEDRLKLKEMSERCAATAEQFTYEHYMKNLIEKILIE